MTKVTAAGRERGCETDSDRALHREAAQQFASDFQQKVSKRLMILVSIKGEKPGSMSSADRASRQMRCLGLVFLWIVLWMVFAVIVPAALCAQSSTSSFGSSITGLSTSSSASASAGGSMQVQTSAQNPVFGSVPEAKLTPGVLPLTFSDAIDRALRQNLAGLLSEYNTVEARGQKWQQLSDLLPNVGADVQEVVEKESLQALGLRSGGPFGKVPPVIGPFSYFDLRASATERVFDWKSIQQYRASVIGESVAKFNLKDARDLVVLATGRNGAGAGRNGAGALQKSGGATRGWRRSGHRHAPRPG
jgi:hypothetical protein